MRLPLFYHVVAAFVCMLIRLANIAVTIAVIAIATTTVNITTNISLLILHSSWDASDPKAPLVMLQR